MAPLTIPSAWLAGHQGYYLESGPETGVLPFILAKRPNSGSVHSQEEGECLEGGSFGFIEAAGSADHLDFILAGELRTKASGRRNSIWEDLMRSWEGRNGGGD